MSPFLLSSAAFLGVTLPILGAVLVLTRGGGVATRRLAGVERLRSQILVAAAPPEATGAVAGWAVGATGGMRPKGGGRGAPTGRLSSSSLGRRLLTRAERDLEFTTWSLSPTAFLLYRLLAGVFAGLVAWLALRQPIAILVAALAAHLFIGRLIARQVKVYRQLIGRQTAEVIDILIAHLRAGQSLGQSLEALAAEAPSPSRGEYSRVARRLALGAPVSEALRAMERRTPITPVSLLISALNLHQRIGGDLPMLLRIAADTVRDQVRLQDELRTAAAGQMLAANVVVALPILLFCALFLIDRPYMSGLLQPGWNLLLVVGAMMEIVGYFVMRSFTRLEL